jgi:hypothetical protein
MAWVSPVHPSTLGGGSKSAQIHHRRRHAEVPSRRDLAALLRPIIAAHSAAAAD